MKPFNHSHVVRSLNRVVRPGIITSDSLKQSIKSTWRNTQYVSIDISNKEFVLVISNAKPDPRSILDIDCFESVTRELNEWHLGEYTLQRLHDITDGREVAQTEVAMIPLGVHVGRVMEFYGIRR